MITKFQIFEALNTPIQDDVPFVYSNWYNNNKDSFKNDIINDLKNKLIGKTIYIDGKRQYKWNKRVEPIDRIVINGLKIKPY